MKKNSNNFQKWLKNLYASGKSGHEIGKLLSGVAKLSSIYIYEAIIASLTKDDIKKAIGRSPNDADAFAMLFYPEIYKPVKVSKQYFTTGVGNPQEITDKTRHKPHLGGQITDMFFGRRDTSTENLDKRGSPLPIAIGRVGASRYGDIKRNQF
ncbi:hypothetical protein IID22_05290 [Patescibacteria group bacterium]|nr:hypothetical protein [Patescibacteria group bacterium]